MKIILFGLVDNDIANKPYLLIYANAIVTVIFDRSRE
jgi:hypothetical protein